MSNTPLFNAAVIGKVADIPRLLAERPSDLDIRCGITLLTALFAAASQGHASVVSLLMKYGANAEIVNRHDYTPLRIATQLGHVEVVIALLENGAKIDAANKKGETAMHIAVQRKQSVVLALLLEKGAKIDPFDTAGNTPFHVACFEDKLPIVLLLLDKGASVNAPALNGRTPLQMALEINSTKIAMQLLLAGAKPSNSPTALAMRELVQSTRKRRELESIRDGVLAAVQLDISKFQRSPAALLILVLQYVNRYRSLFPANRADLRLPEELALRVA